ncbi:cryptococcal mannosyltransferase 1-domain-containing protein [Aspergillus pseudoustus]|uniref:Cryptococcal mannosyltransferase 1-domain-containing protein n=1 Tax=Aspergillus pseudoustus TaxID=1810923 RepID=A0ABR4K0K8_9EURO
MSTPLLAGEEYELSRRSSVGSERLPEFDEEQIRWRQDSPRSSSWLGRKLAHTITRLSGFSVRPGLRTSVQYQQQSQSRPVYRVVSLLRIALGGLLACILLTAIFFPSYTHLPPHYKNLQARVQNANRHGAGNPRNETVFIAAVLYDPLGEIAHGPWGNALVRLIKSLGEENVFLSIYENSSGGGEGALQALAEQVTCNKSIVSEAGLQLGSLPRVDLPGGEKRVRRIDYLAELRNRALLPLDQRDARRYDKLLYLNDVVFDPVDALQLLFSTNADTHGVAQYRAACAVDFINPFKFYDTYATRDLQGYEIGLPFYPWFTSAGKGASRRDVLSGRDAVRVRSCWGGMVAFDAHHFQGPDPVRFRAAGPELFWDASECCLVHADIQDRPSRGPDGIADTGIYMNPFVRVSYDARSHSWLWTTRRFEKLYSTVHGILSGLMGLPKTNPRRSEVPGRTVHNTVWMAEEDTNQGKGLGKFRKIERKASNDGFCGRRGMEVVLENRTPGQDGFETVPVPYLPHR